MTSITTTSTQRQHGSSLSSSSSSSCRWWCVHVALLWISISLLQTTTLGYSFQPPSFVGRITSARQSTRTSTRSTCSRYRSRYPAFIFMRLDASQKDQQDRSRKPNSNKRSSSDADASTRSSNSSKKLTGVSAQEADSNNMNWMEPSMSIEKPDTFDVKLQGSSFQVGALAQRLYLALSSRQERSDEDLVPKSKGSDDSEDANTLKTIAMELAAHQAIRLAVEQNGLELECTNDEQMEYDAIESIQLVQSQSSSSMSMSMSAAQQRLQQQQQYTTWDDAATEWTVGDNFDFLLRGVRAKQRKLTTQDLLRSLDPDGSYREQAMKAGIEVPTDENELKAAPTESEGDDDDDDMAQLPQPKSLAEMAQDNVRRREAAPVPAVAAEQAFAGNTLSRGYRPLSMHTLASTSLMMNDDDDSNNFAPAVMHVMDALISHGCLIVDVTDGGVHMDRAVVLKDMWQAAGNFFQHQDDQEDQELTMPQGMVTVAETGSSHAKVGYASYDNDNLQFLETRLERSSGMLLPEQAQYILGKKGSEALQQAFGVVASAAKDIVRLTVAASSVEAGVLTGDAASKAALLLANELVDDSRALPKDTDIEHSECAVSMSPHRLCRYSNNGKKEKKTSDSPTREVFGAHTDSSFVTAVPVAAVAGLEVYDEAEEQWYRPEKAVRKHWQNERIAAGKDPEALTETTADDGELPWHSRYVVMVPGELLQLATRNEVPAAVHRVVATEGKASRLSAPILLRGRSGMTLDIDRYLGSTGGDPLLEEVSGMTIEQIHDSMQAPPQ